MRYLVKVLNHYLFMLLFLSGFGFYFAFVILFVWSRGLTHGAVPHRNFRPALLLRFSKFMVKHHAVFGQPKAPGVYQVS